MQMRGQRRGGGIACPPGQAWHCPGPGEKAAPCSCKQTGPCPPGYHWHCPGPGEKIGPCNCSLDGVGSFLVPETAVDHRNRGIVMGTAASAVLMGVLGAAMAPRGELVRTAATAFAIGAVFGVVTSSLAAIEAQKGI